jgi:hypothetical protein
LISDKVPPNGRYSNWVLDIYEFKGIDSLEAMLKLIFEKYKIFRGPDEELIPNGVICILCTKLPKRYSAVQL